MAIHKFLWQLWYNKLFLFSFREYFEASQGSNTFNQGEGIISGDPLFVATEAITV